MDAEQHVAKCSYGEDGMCALHGVEVERRKGMEALTSNIPKMLSWQNRILGWSMLVTAFMLGNYAYTNQIKNEMKLEYASGIGSTSAEIKIMTKQLEQLATGQARTEERYASLLRSITELNSSVNTLTYLQFEKKEEAKKPR